MPHVPPPEAYARMSWHARARLVGYTRRRKDNGRHGYEGTPQEILEAAQIIYDSLVPEDPDVAAMRRRALFNDYELPGFRRSKRDAS
jgi:hypothetical protein